MKAMKKYILLVLIGLVLASVYALIYFQKERELHAISSEKAIERLSDYHEYEDGIVDQPILNADTTMEE